MGKGKFTIQEFSKSVGKAETNACAIIFVIGVGLCIAGGILLSGELVDTRGALMSTYNAAVDHFQKQVRPQFSNAPPFFAKGSTTMNESRLAVDTSYDSLKDWDPILKMYTSLKYSTNGAFFKATSTQTMDKQMLTFRSGSSSWNYDVSPVIKRELLTSDSYLRCDPSSKPSSIQACQDKCIKKGGLWVATPSHGYKCHVYYYLHDICFKTAPSPSIYVPSAVYGDIGCMYEPLGEFEYITGPFSPYTYKVYDLNGGSVPAFITPTTTNVHARETADPFVIAEYLTQGKLYFGPTVQEKITWGLFLLIVGLAGVCVTFCAFIYAYRRWMASGREMVAHGAYVRHDDEIDVVGDL